MKKLHIWLTFLGMILFTQAFVSKINAQTETYTGTVISYGSGLNTRSVSRTFTLNLTGQTSKEQAQGYLDILQEGKQDDLLKAIQKQDLGRFSVGANIGVPINVVRESTVDGKRRVFIVFERWTQFAELRGGYRSLDYPFGVIEIFIDPQTGKGEGTYIAAAKIRWNFDEKKQQYEVEIENFGTFPARLLGVSERGVKRKQVKVGN